MREEEFKFNLGKNVNYKIYQHWSDIFSRYFKQLYDIDDFKLKVENLKYQDPNNKKNIIEFKTGVDLPYTADKNVNDQLQLIVPHKGCLKVELLVPLEKWQKLYIEKFKISKDYFDDDLDDEEEDTEDDLYREAASFLMYGQNNCCGASSTSLTYVDQVFENRKLATILQYFKEDLCRYQGSSLLTCTDIYYKGYKGPLDEVEKLSPYLPNTKVLLNTGWKVGKLFYNPNSANVVGLFNKDIKTYYEVEQNLEVVMKIKLKDDNLVKIDVDKVTIGCDPELFLKSKETGEYVPSFFVMEGDKDKPTDITKDGHNIQCDNVMVEYGIPPCKNEDEFVKHNLFVQKYIKEKVADPNNLTMVIFPSARFEEQNLLDERARKFGCDPDYNAHTGGTPNTVGNTNTTWRCSGGHIHVGYENHNYKTNLAIVKAMDLFLSVPLILMEPENKRKEMYGKAGAFRHQKHGVEYRVTSNYIYSSEELMRWAYKQTLKAIAFVNTDTFKSCYDFGRIASAIDNKDVKLAKALIEKYKSFGVEVLENSKKLVKS